MITEIPNSLEFQQMLQALSICGNQCVFKLVKDTNKISTVMPVENGQFIFYAILDLENQKDPFKEESLICIEGINQFKTGLELLKFPSVIEVYKNYLLCKEKKEEGKNNNNMAYFKFGLAEPNTMPSQLNMTLNLKKILKEMSYPYSFRLTKDQRQLIEKLTSVVDIKGFVSSKLYFEFWPESNRLSVIVGDKTIEMGNRAEILLQEEEEKGDKITFNPLSCSMLKYLNMIKSTDIVVKINEQKTLMIAKPIIPNSQKVDYIFLLTFLKENV